MIDAFLNVLNRGSRWGNKVRYVVLHWTASSSFDSAFRELKKNGTSYHYIVDGETIWSLVDEKYAAYHAGVYTTNLQSVGVSHIGLPGLDVKEGSYATSGRLIAEILKRNNLEPTRNVVRLHREIKATACPGTLDVERLMGEVRRFYYGEQVTLPVVPQDNPQPVEIPVNNYPKQVKNISGLRLRIRKEANTDAEIMGYKQPDETFTVIGDTQGQAINNNSVWLNTGYGYVSSEYAREF